MSLTVQRRIPSYITIILFLIMAVVFFIETPVTIEAANIGSEWISIVMAFMMGIGVLTILAVHVRRVYKMEKTKGIEWYYSLMVIIPTILTVILGFVYGEGDPIYTWLAAYVSFPVAMTAIRLQMWWLVLALYRLGRFRSVESFLYMGMVALSLFGLSPLGESLIPVTGVISNWFLTVLGPAISRGVYMSLYIGATLLTFRYLLGWGRGVATEGV